MPSNLQQALLECGCGCGCGGCCLPVDLTQPLYPDGVLIDVGWEISAPLCPSIDGATGSFSPINPTNPVLGGCGYCAGYSAVSAGTIMGILRIDLAGVCVASPCSINLCFALECLAEDSPVDGLSTCCGKLRLWIGTDVLQVEDTGERPTSSVEGLACSSWKKVSPTSCSCLEGGAGFSARFPLSLNFNCGTISTGACAGYPDCCVVSCDLTGAEFVI